MICENWDPFKKNKREALIKKMVLKRLGDEIRAISYQKFVFFMPERRSGRPSYHRHHHHHHRYGCLESAPILRRWLNLANVKPAQSVGWRRPSGCQKQAN